LVFDQLRGKGVFGVPSGANTSPTSRPISSETRSPVPSALEMIRWPLEVQDGAGMNDGIRMVMEWRGM